jgi:hypothetical protein
MRFHNAKFLDSKYAPVPFSKLANNISTMEHIKTLALEM